MKKQINILVKAFIMLTMAIYFSSCGGDEQGDFGSQTDLTGTKWTSQNWDYDIADDGEWAYYFDEIYTVYFYSQSEGVAYYGRKTVDSDNGTSRRTCACFFKYSVNGDEVEIESITEPFGGFQYYYTLNRGKLECYGWNLTKGNINFDDTRWLNTITGTTGCCTWYDSCDGVLTVAGNGDMADYKSYSETPWNKKYRPVSAVTILNGVTSVGAYAFASPTLGEVDFSYGNLQKINAHAFENSSIGEVDFGDNLIFIGNGAFAGCKYASVTLPSSIEKIDDYAFYNCKSVYLGYAKKLREVGQFAFSGCKINGWLDSNVLEVVGTVAFTNIDVRTIKLPAIKELGQWAFTCKNVNVIHIGSSLEKVTSTPFDCASSGTLSISVKTPLKLDCNFINGENVGKWTLNVPYGSETAYKTAAYWKNFKTIKGG